MTICNTILDLTALKTRLQQASAREHRQLLLLASATPADPALVIQLLTELRLDHQAGWYCSTPDPGNSVALENSLIELIPKQAWDTALGREFSAIVLDAHAGFDCDAMAALSGTIMSGGILLLLTPPLPLWPKRLDLESQRISAWRETICEEESLYLVRFRRLLSAATSPVPLSTDIHVRVLHNESAADAPADRYSGQKRLIQRLVDHGINGQEKTLLVTADRGRGKSAALGMAAARLVSEHNTSVLVCAHGKLAVEILYQHFKRKLPARTALELRFCPPDRLSSQSGSADILFVDEAANIPLPLLQQAAAGFKRSVFASTVQGYEGAGRGFAIRFTQWLEKNSIKHNHLTLEHPVRWQVNDPLEAFTNRAFLLDAPLTIAPPDTSLLDARNAQLLPLDTHQLSQDEPQLRELFGLLVQAHYKTRPNDLRHILDANNLQCFALKYADRYVAAALVAIEGPLHNLPLRQGILQKRRRPAGHLLPQLLAQYTGMAVALDLKIARVVRIAVHPEIQRRGLGSVFLQRLRSWFNDVDALAAQFSASGENRAFWEKNGFVVCHQGARKHSSGGHRSMVVFDAMTDCARQCAKHANILFSDEVHFDASDRGTSATLYDEFVLARYIAMERNFADSHAAVSRAAVRILSNPEMLLNDTDTQLLLALQCPECHLATVAKQCSIAGTKALESRLRSMLQRSTRTSP